MSSPLDDFISLASEPALKRGMIDREAPKVPAFLVDGLQAAEVLKTLKTYQEGDQAQADEVHICLFAASYDLATPVDAVVDFMNKARQGATPVNILAQQHGLGMRVLDLAVARPHKPFTWDDRATAAAMAYGMEAVATGGDLLCLGDIAFGNEAFALAIAAGCLRQSQDVSPLLEAPEKPIHQQMAALLAGVPDGAGPLQVLKTIGGQDVAAAAGALLAARVVGLPLLIEGAALLAATAIVSSLGASVDHVFLASTNSAGERALANALQMTPIVSGHLGIGPGAGLAMAHRVIKGACDLQGLRVK